MRLKRECQPDLAESKHRRDARALLALYALQRFERVGRHQFSQLKQQNFRSVTRSWSDIAATSVRPGVLEAPRGLLASSGSPPRLSAPPRFGPRAAKRQPLTTRNFWQFSAILCTRLRVALRIRNTLELWVRPIAWGWWRRTRRCGARVMSRARASPVRRDRRNRCAQEDVGRGRGRRPSGRRVPV
jgi:hypothetical protein